MSLFKKGAVAAIGGSAVLVGLTGAPAFASGTYTGTSPYPIPQSAPGVPNSDAESITVTGEPANTVLYAALCDGVTPTDPTWSGATGADCGPWGPAVRTNASGVATFTQSTIQLFHGDDLNNQVDAGFNCLASDDDPNGGTTFQGNMPIDNGEPSFGDSAGNTAGGNPNNVSAYPGGTSDPCQIEIVATGTPAPTSWNASAGDVAIPVDETEIAPPQTPESPVAIALPVGAAVLLGGGSIVALRRRRRVAA